jgi:hypothetical protein
MLYRDEGTELCLSLCAGNSDKIVTVPENVKRLGPSSFTDSNCEKIIFENLCIEAEDTTFDRSVWLNDSIPAAYVGNMLYRISAHNTGRRLTIILTEGTERIHKSVFRDLYPETELKLCIPEGMKIPGFTDAIVAALMNEPVKDVHKRAGLVTVSRKASEGQVEKEIPIPLSLDSNGMELLRRTLDYGEDLYDEIFDRINNRKEKLDYALLAAAVEYDIAQYSYRKFINENQDEAAIRAAELLDEEALFRLIKRNHIGKEALIKILPKLQERGMRNATAGILVALNKGDK